jgi:MFS family permease
VPAVPKTLAKLPVQSPPAVVLPPQPAAAPPAAAEPRHWRNIVTLAVTIFFTLTFVFSWSRVISNYLRHLGASPQLIGWCFLIFTAANRLPGVLGGWISDHVGRKGMIVAGTFFMGIGFIGVAYAPTPLTLTAALCFTWIVGALQHPSLLSIQAESVPAARRGTAIAIVEACAMLGITVGPLLEAFVFRWSGNSLASTWRLLAISTSAIYLLVCLARLTFLRDTDRGRHERTPFKPDWKRLSIPLAVTVCFVAAMLISIDGPSVSLYIVDVTGGDEATVGYVNFWGGALAIAGALLGGWLADSVGATRVMAWSAAATAACLLPFAFPGNADLDRFLIALVFLPIETFVIANWKLVASIGPPGRRALYVGMVTTTTGLVSSWAVVGSGYLYAGPNQAAPMLAAVALALVSLVLTLRLLRLASPGRDPGHLA